MIDFKPKKLPKQARSRASFDAIVEAAARLLESAPYDTLTTNHIAERAGVSIGTLYEFFPNKEAIVAMLAERCMSERTAAMHAALETASRMDDPWRGVAHMLDAAVNAVVAERAVYHALFRQIPFVPRLPSVMAAREEMIELAQLVRIRAGDRLNMPLPEEDAWLISQMLYNAILEIAFLETGERKRAELTRELARLTYRMAVGRDPEAG